MPRLKQHDGRLNGPELQQLRDALLDAFTLGSLTEMLRFRLDRHREHLSLANDLPTIVLDVLTRAEYESWTAELLTGARASSPQNARLLAVAQQFGLATATPPRRELELRITEAGGLLDVVRWRERLGRAEGRVCRVEVTGADGAGEALGTGFLLGPDLVLTNHHVVAPVLRGDVPATRLAFRFDYKVLGDGVVLNPGRVHRAAPDWDVDHSPPSPLDEQVDPPQAPGADELDHALVRLAEPAGSEPLSAGAGAEADAPPRGWFEPPVSPHDFTKHPALFILQHPAGGPLRLAVDTDAVLGTAGPDGAPTRVRYRTTTEPGSSGSPCFDADWNLVAVHHSGDPKYLTGAAPRYNQGVPVAAVLALLAARGKADLLGAQEP
ncbi:trypsin-like peptidase domain-containing protein [Thalassiella azotivora]